MSELAAVETFKWPVSLRLVVALLLGLQFGLLAFYQPPSAIWLWVPWLPLIILLAATVASIWFDPRVRHGEINAEHMLQGLIRFLLTILGPILLVLIAFFFIRSVGALVLALIPLTLGVITAFILIGNRHTGLAVICALLAWLGAGVPFLLSTYLTSKQPGNELGSLVFVLLMFGVITGFVFAALGGILGRLLRRWVLG
jgi:hypothetical protein